MKKVLSTFLIAGIVLSNIPSAFAANITTSGGANDVPVELTQEVTSFSVTVPTVLPVDVDADGVVTVATENKIINNSFGPVEIKNVEVEAQNSWTLVDFETDFAQKKVGLKEFGFQINNENVAIDGNCNTRFDVIDGNSEINFTYNSTVASQSAALENEQIANVIFTIGWYDGFESIVQLTKKYKFEYYSTLNLAANDISNETIGDNADAEKTDAVAGVYTDENGKVTLMVLKPVNITETVVLSGDATLDLGGQTITSSASTAFDLSGNVIVDATRGGGIAMTGETGVALCALHFTSGTGTINNGKYTIKTNDLGTTKPDTAAAIIIDNGANVTINNITAIANDDISGAITPIIIHEGGSATINNSYCEGNCKKGYNVAGIANWGNLVATNSKFIGISDYLGNEAGNDYGVYSRGVYSYGNTEFYDCYSYGTHTALCIFPGGSIIVDGGTYEGYGHGGAYINSGEGKTVSLYNAKFIGLVEMPEGYISDDIVGNNYAGIYIGGTDTTVYMDNCDIYGAWQPIVLRDTREILYVSNSRTNTDWTKYPVRISSNSTLYLGIGNNFTKNQTSRPANVVETNEVYK